MKTKRKGFTLMEMCIVLALVGIVGTMVTSFCIMVSGDTGRTQSVVDLQSDIQFVQNKMAKWVARFDTEEFYFDCISGENDENGNRTNILCAYKKTSDSTSDSTVTTGSNQTPTPDGTKANPYKLRIVGGSIQGDMPDSENNIYISLDSTTGAYFELEAKDSPITVKGTFFSETATDGKYTIIRAIRVATVEANKIPKVVTFGNYNETPIRWLVLEEYKNNGALLLCETAIASMPYNSTGESSTWDGCSLKTWLEGEFKTKTFNQTTDEKTNECGCIESISLLTKDEFTDKLLKVYSYYTVCEDSDYKACPWWICQNETDSESLIYITTEGNIVYTSDSKVQHGVRPVIRVNEEQYQKLTSGGTI